MKYFFDLFEIPNEQRKWIVKERANIDSLIEYNKKTKLSKLEDEYLKWWVHWKDEVDKLSSIRGRPNVREEMIKARFELTKYNEILKYCGLKNPRSMIKMKELAKI